MINGITFDLQNAQSADDAKLFYRLLGKQNGVLDGCGVSAAGRVLTVAAGYLEAYGRISKITGTEQLTAPTTTGTLYCRLVYEIDLSQTNTAQAFNQGTLKILSSSSAYPSLTQENLETGGNVFQIPLAKFTATASAVSNLTDERVTVYDGGKYLNIGGTVYQLRTSTTDAGQAGYITFVTGA